MTNIEVRFNPPDLPQRMKHYPQKLQQEMERTMKESLIHVQGSVPPYPPARPMMVMRRIAAGCSQN